MQKPEPCTGTALARTMSVSSRFSVIFASVLTTVMQQWNWRTNWVQSTIFKRTTGTSSSRLPEPHDLHVANRGLGSPAFLKGASYLRLELNDTSVHLAFFDPVVAQFTVRQSIASVFAVLQEPDDKMTAGDIECSERLFFTLLLSSVILARCSSTGLLYAEASFLL